MNFGKEVGGAAVLLLKNGISGMTVIGVNHGKIQYQPTHEVIRQRYVDLSMVSFYEHLGVCFGREAKDVKLTFEEKKGDIERFL